MREYLKNIARNVRERRVAQELSQMQLAKRAEVTNRYVSMLETEALEDLRLSKLDDIADALGCSIMDLLHPVASKSKSKPALPRYRPIEIPKEAIKGVEVAIKVLNQAVRQANKRKG